jgi:phospholipase/lecithinase/hemolysin
VNHVCRYAVTRVLAAVVFAAAAAATVTPATAQSGVAVLGDSLGDEYQFPINFPLGGDRRAAKNYVELLSSLRPASFDFGPFSAASRGAPRNQGFLYDWARDGATSSELLAEGQHTGAAAQIAGGQVGLALVEIGGNDFRGVFLPGANPAQIASDALTNTLTAVGTLLAASSTARVAVANVPDITLLPEARFAAAQDPTLVPLLAQVSGLIDQYNAGLAAQLGALPAADRVALVDVNGIFDAIINDPRFTVGGLSVDTLFPGDGPGHLFADVVHPGTVGSGKLANGFIDAINTRFGDTIIPLSDQELLTAAVPEPAGILTALVVAPLLACRPRRPARRRMPLGRHGGVLTGGFQRDPSGV